MTDKASKLVEQYAALGWAQDTLARFLSRTGSAAPLGVGVAAVDAGVASSAAAVNSVMETNPLILGEQIGRGMIDQVNKVLQNVDVGHFGRHADQSVRIAAHQLVELVDLVFGFNRFGKQLLLIVILQMSIGFGRLGVQAAANLLRSFTEKGAMLTSLHRRLSEAETYSQWLQIAVEIDKLTEKDKWRADNTSSLFDRKVLQKRINDIKELIEDRDMFTLLFRLRGGVCRDQFGIQNEGLFTKALSGPKLIVEQYYYTLCEALDFVCSTEDETIPTEVKLAFFNETRHAYGRTALLV
jgi:hypothetical protein